MNAKALLTLALVIAGTFCTAAEPPASSADMAIVPYDPTKPVSQQKPDQFYLPYERFLQLWEAAKAHRTDRKLEPAGVAFVLSTARYEGVLGERAITFTGKLDVTTYNEAWVPVPLPFKDVKVSTLKIDGVTAVYDGEKIIVEKPGRHQVEVAFEIPLARGVQALEWGIPRTTATLVVLTLPDDRTRAMVTPGSGVIEQTENGKKRITAALGATDRVRLEWKASAGAARIAESALAAIRTQLISRIGREEAVSEFAFTFPGARQDRFTVYLEKGLTLTRLEATNVKSWRLTAEDARQALEIVLNEPVEETYSFQIGVERPLSALPADLKAPAFSAAARRVEYTALALEVGERIELTPRPDAGQRQIPWDRAVGADVRLVAAYAGAGQPGYHVALRETRREARVDYVYQVNRRKIELIASLQLYSRGDDLSNVTLSLPAQFDVQAVESERWQDWWREGDVLHIRFRGTTPVRTPLMIYLVRQYAAAPTDLDVRPLVLEGFKKIEGEAVVAAHKGVEATMKLSADAKEMAPELAATDFQILPPLERKRGFAFKNQTFSAQVALAALPARTGALWVMHAQAHEGWVALSTHARLTMRQGSIDRVTFSLPAAVAEARVSGEEVRETRSRVEGDRRVYEVQFQNDVYESVEFTLDLELPNPGEVALPSIAFPEAQMTSGYVLTDNASEFEMTVNKSGVDDAPPSEIPFLPELSKSAGIYRVQPNWAVTMVVKTLEKAAARTAFVAWAELTTALRRDGTEWHRATYRLLNRSLQFLPVKMPAGAELMSVRVAGQSVRADAGKVGATEAILVPLIKTKPGDLSYDVEIVYRLNTPELGWWARRDLDDPELLGITVERTFWNVWLPEDRKLQNTSGNMEPVLAEVNKADKLEGSLQELKSLVSIASSNRSSYHARTVAIGNIQRLKKEIESDNRDENFAQSTESKGKGGKAASPTPAEETVGKGGIAKQGAYVNSKRRDINNQLEQEVKKLGEATLDLNGANQQAVNVGTLNGAGQLGVNAGTLTLNGANGNMANAANPSPGTVVNQGTLILNGSSQTLNITNNATIANNANPQGERWTANGGFLQQGKPAATPPPPAGALQGNNFYFNDNVVLQQKVAAPEDKAPEPAKKKMALPAKPSGNVFYSGGTKGYAAGIPQPGMPAEPDAAADEKKAPQTSLNTSRGNTLRYQEEQINRQQEALTQQRANESVRPVPPPASAAVPAFGAAPAAPAAAPAQQAFAPQRPPTIANAMPVLPPPGIPALPGLEPVPAMPAMPQQPPSSQQLDLGSLTLNAGRLAVPGADATRGGPALQQAESVDADAEAQRLQTAGRISLAVDFPTEGQLFHFKKVKANAHLALTVMTPETFVRWQYLAVAVALAAMLAWLNRLATRRRQV